MSFVREPRIHPVAIKDLRPTQITVGMGEVAAKRERWRHHDPKTRADFLGSHMVPVVVGPRHKPYLIDHHHLARALFDEGVAQVAVTIVADLSALSRDAFFTYLDNRSWSHLYDEDGVRRDHEHLPKHVDGLIDDPYRSLAGALRRAGGFAKDTTPFSEFLWADFLRRRIRRHTARADPQGALRAALEMAKSPEANYLPGWCGPCEEG